MKTYRAELHIHTVLSPCAEVEMIPPLIVEAALDQDLNLIAVTDHNATANIAAVQKAAQDSGLVVMPGMEIQTREEVHVLCLFDHIDQIQVWQRLVDGHMPELKNDPDVLGEQFVVDETGDFIRREERLLIVSVDLSIEQVFQHVREFGGLAIPAHVDRPAFGLLAQLGWVPPDLDVSVLEVSRHLNPQTARQKFPELIDYPLVRGGDAHRLNELLGANVFTLANPTISELRLAFLSERGRSLIVG